jgi:uncharacterized protein YhjY with autotransporter beta-barrel domain
VTTGINNGGTFNAAGSMTGDFNNSAGGVLKTTGAFALTGNLNNAAAVSIEAGQSLSATNISNFVGAALSNAGTLSTSNAVQNYGNLTNSGSMSGGLVVNTGQVHNLAGGSIAGGTTINGGSVISDGAISGNVLVQGGNLFISGIATGLVTVNAGTIGGTAGTLGGLVIDGGTALDSASLTVSGNTIVKSGVMAATIDGGGTGVIAMNGGTFSGAANGFQSFVHSGGALSAGSSIDTFGYGRTGGSDGGADITAQLYATAIGGTITSLTQTFTDVSNTAGGVTIVSAGGTTLGGVSTFSTGASDITINGAIAGTNGISAVAEGAGSSINIRTVGAISTSSTAISMVSDPAGGSAVAQVFGNISVSSGAAALVGSGNAEFNVADGVTINANNILSSLSGLTILNNSGDIAGAFQSGPGNVLVRNMLGGELTLDAASSSSFSGVNDRFLNAGVLTATEVTTLGGLELFTNTSTGSIDVSDGDGSDHLTFGGNMTSLTGSQILMDIDLSTATDAGQNDSITVLGNLTSTGGVFVLNNIGAPGVFADFNDLLLIDAGSVDPNAQFSVAGLDGLGLFTYQAVVSATDSTNIVLRSVLDGQAAGGIVSNFITAQNSVSNAFFKPASGFVSSPLDPARNQLGFAPWFRASGGLTSQGSTGVALLAAGPQAVESQVNVSFGGYQFGLDGGVFNIAGSGASVHLGLTAGQILGAATQRDYNNKTTMKDTFIGAYGIFSNGPFFLDAQLRQEFIDYTVNIDDRGFVINDGNVDSQRLSAGVSGGYAFGLGRFSIVPAAGYTFAKTTTDNLNFTAAGTNAFVQFDDTTSHLAFAGVSASTNFLLFDDQLRVSPFVSVTAYHDFGKDQSASLQVPTLVNPTIDVTSGSGKTYGEVSLGANFLTLTPEIAGTQRLLSGNVRGDVQFGEDRLGGSVNAQLRLQF